MTAINGAFCARKWGWSTSLTQIFPDRHIRYILHDKHWCAGYWKSWQPDKLMCRFWDTTGDSDVPPPDLQAGKLSFVAFSSHSLSLTFWLNHCDICGRWGGEILRVSAEWCPHPLISLRISLLLPPPYITQQSHSGSPSLMSHPLTSLMTTSGNWCEDFGTQLVSVMSHPPICRQENFHLLLFK